MTKKLFATIGLAAVATSATLSASAAVTSRSYVTSNESVPAHPSGRVIAQIASMWAHGLAAEHANCANSQILAGGRSLAVSRKHTV